MNPQFSTPVMPPSHSVAAYAGATNSEYASSYRNKAVKKDKLSDAIQFFLKNQTYSLFSIILLAFFTPVLTNMAGARDNHPAVQDLIKVVCYVGGFSASLYGAVAESDKKLMIERVREDAKTNTDFAIEKLLLRQKGTERLTYAFSLMDGGNTAPEAMLGNSPFTWHERALPPSRDGDPGYTLMPMPQEQPSNSLAPDSVPVTSSSPIIKGDFTAPQQNGVDGDDAKTAKEKAKAAIDRVYSYITDLSDKQYINFLVFGRTGDNKSTMLQYAQYQLLQRDPGTVFMVHDRKFYASGKKDPKFPSVWAGIPVYDKALQLAGSQYPFSHTLTEDVPDFASWLKPIEKLYQIRNSAIPVEKDPLYDAVNKRVRPVVLILEDATTTLQEYKARTSKNKAKYDETIILLGRIATLMRSSGIFVWFVTHDCTTDATDIPQFVMEQLHPIIGSSFAGNRKQLAMVKEEPIAEGLSLASASASQKVKGFATSFAKAPYIPPAPIKSTLEMVDPETVLNSHYGAVAGFRVMPYHLAALKKLGLKGSDLGVMSMNDVTAASSVSSAHKPTNPSSRPVSQSDRDDFTGTAFESDPDFDVMDIILNSDQVKEVKQEPEPAEYPEWSAEANGGSEEVEEAQIAAILINLRSWYKGYGRVPPNQQEVLDQVMFDFNLEEEAAKERMPNIMALLQANASRFGEELLGDPTYKDDPVD